MDVNLLQAVCRAQQERQKAALVTIVETHGSTPRKAGSRMLIFPNGDTNGTIGGGCGEAEVRRQALLALDAGRSGLYTLSMTNRVAEDEGMVCGGQMEVFIQLLSEWDKADEGDGGDGRVAF